MNARIRQRSRENMMTHRRTKATAPLSFSLLVQQLVVLLVGLLLVRAPLLAQARRNSKSILGNDASTIRLTRTKIELLRQRLMRGRLRKQSDKAEMKAKKSVTQTKTKGSTLTLGLPPTRERLTAWFGASSRQSSNEVSAPQKVTFNHDCAGMTNPCLHVASSSGESSSSSDDTRTTTLVSATKKQPATTDANSSNGSVGWWPSTTAGTRGDLARQHWRVLQFQSRVGHGVDCYQRVRDAALAWEFTSRDGLKGIRNVLRDPEPSEPSADFSPPRSPFAKRFRNGPGYTVLPVQEEPESQLEKANDDTSRIETNSGVQQIWSGPGRRLVTFTSIPLLPKWLSAKAKLYCFNPVHVVYDLVDQRAPSSPAATTAATAASVSKPSSTSPQTQCYSSTAYATGAGHWLRGEERVTVALRDNGSVDVQILSCSKPAASFMGRLVWPVIGKMQRKFFVQQLEALQDVASVGVKQQDQPSNKEPVSVLVRPEFVSDL